MKTLQELKSIKYFKNVTEEEFTLLQSIFAWTKTRKEAIICLRENITVEPKCQYPNCNKTKYFNPTGSRGYTKGCCKSHTVKITMLENHGVENPGQLETSKQKVKKTCLAKYGETNVFKVTAIKEKSKKTNIEKYGVEHSSQRREWSTLCKQTSMEKFGTEYPNQSHKIKEKIKQTCLQNYGVENVGSVTRDKAMNTMMKKYGCHTSQLNEVKAKIMQTCLKRFGVKYPMQSTEILSKVMETNKRKYDSDFIFGSEYFINKSIELYGVRNPIQCVEIIEKHQKSCYLMKKFKWNTGETSIVQGYEPIVLKELEDEGYNFETVLTSTKDMPEFWYEYEGKKKRYYPDFYIPSENLIIEVKSNYTLNKNLEINKLKFQAVKDANFNFRLEVR